MLQVAPHLQGPEERLSGEGIAGTLSFIELVIEMHTIAALDNSKNLLLPSDGNDFPLIWYQS